MNGLDSDGVQRLHDRGSDGLADGASRDDHDLLVAVLFKQLRDLGDGAFAADGYGFSPGEAAGAEVKYGLEAAVICFL